MCTIKELHQKMTDIVAVKANECGGRINLARKIGCSDRLERLLSQCEKLEGTNLFYHHARLLRDMWLEDEIQSIVKYVEDACYELYCGEIGEKTRCYLECFQEIYSDYLYDEETETIYSPHKLDVA